MYNVRSLLQLCQCCRHMRLVALTTAPKWWLPWKFWTVRYSLVTNSSYSGKLHVHVYMYTCIILQHVMLLQFSWIGLQPQKFGLQKMLIDCNPILIFSQSLLALSYIESLLVRRPIPIPHSGGPAGEVQYSGTKWSKNVNFCREFKVQLILPYIYITVHVHQLTLHGV